MKNNRDFSKSDPVRERMHTHTFPKNRTQTLTVEAGKLLDILTSVSFGRTGELSFNPDEDSSLGKSSPGMETVTPNKPLLVVAILAKFSHVHKPYTRDIRITYTYLPFGLKIMLIFYNQKSGDKKVHSNSVIEHIWSHQ